MVKHRFIYGYPRFFGIMLIICGMFLVAGIIPLLLIGDYTGLALLIQRLQTQGLEILGPILFGFPLALTMMFIMMGETWENWEDEYK